MLSDQALHVVLSERGEVIVPVAVGDTSMIPHIAGGDRVAVVSARAVPHPGEILVYGQNDYLVVHRYLGPARTPDGRPCLRTRGDGRNQLDPPVLSDAVRGRVIAVEHAGQWRSLEGRAARTYGRLVAWHALFWAAAGVAGKTLGVQGLVAAVDKGVLGLGASTISRLVHRRVAPPATAGPTPSV